MRRLYSLRQFLNDARAPWAFAGLMFVFYATLVVNYYPLMNSDVVNRYAIMAEEFAEGNFRMAFHPRFCVFFQVITGVLCWMTGVSGLVSCQLVSTAGWCFSAVPLWHLARRMGGLGCAWWTVFLLMLVPEYLSYGGTGLRDGVKIFAVAAIGWGFVASSVWLAVGTFVLMTLRVEGIVIGAVILIIYGVYQLLVARAINRVVLPLIAALVGLLLDSALVYCYTGVFVPCLHFLRFL